MVEKKPMDLKIVLRCRICEDTFIIDANTEDFNKWRKDSIQKYFPYMSPSHWRDGNANTQECFPYMSPSHRGLLLTGICEDCWDMMFRGSEEEQSRQRDKKGG